MVAKAPIDPIIMLENAGTQRSMKGPLIYIYIFNSNGLRPLPLGINYRDLSARIFMHTIFPTIFFQGNSKLKYVHRYTDIYRVSHSKD